MSRRVALFLVIPLLFAASESISAQRVARLPLQGEPRNVVVVDSITNRIDDFAKRSAAGKLYNQLSVSQQVALIDSAAPLSSYSRGDFTTAVKRWFKKLARFTKQPVNKDFLDLLLASANLGDNDRQHIVDSILVLVSNDPVSEATLITLLKSNSATAPIAEYIARTIVLQVNRNGADTSERSKFDVLSAASTSGSQDRARLLTTAEVFRYEDGILSFRLATAVAVTNADTVEVEQIDNKSAAAYRRRISDVLVALQDGGSLSASIDLRPWQSKSPRRGFIVDFSAVVAKTGSVTELRKSRSIGMVGEIDFYSRTKPTKEGETSGIVLSARGGVRHAPNGIVFEVPTAKTLGFFQLMLEGKSPISSLPIGVKTTWVSKKFKHYAPDLEFFGIVGL
jgi:hypothetical protein